jgi:nucleoid-associated protein YgaU
MGIFDFVTEAGEVLLGGLGKNKEEDSKVLRGKVEDLGLSLENLGVEIDGDRAILTGRAASEAEREKAVVAAGNTPGISAIDDQLEVTKPAPKSQYYKVVSGDSLSKIAKSFYGDPMKYPALFEANQPMLKHPDKIYPG